MLGRGCVSESPEQVEYSQYLIEAHHITVQHPSRFSSKAASSLNPERVMRGVAHSTLRQTGPLIREALP